MAKNITIAIGIKIGCLYAMSVFHEGRRDRVRIQTCKIFVEGSQNKKHCNHRTLFKKLQMKYYVDKNNVYYLFTHGFFFIFDRDKTFSQIS